MSLANGKFRRFERGIAMNKPLVSIIVRTCGRPHVLEKALDSIRTQRYENIETVVIEDGENISEEYIKEKFSDMNLIYSCTGTKVGRCVAGNLGLERATGKYLNFLDDDDILMLNHVDILVEALENNPCRVAYAVAEEHQIRITDSATRTYKVRRKFVRYKQPFNRLLLCYMNYIPIQSIMFEKTLYDQLGGLDEKLDVLEDWDLWLRYALENDFLFVNTVTSIYYTPYKNKQKRSRESYMHDSEENVIRKHAQYQLSITAEQANKDMNYILNIFNKKGFLFYMQKVRNFLLYRDI